MTTKDHWLHGEGMTVRQIARELGISPMRVRQIEARALEKLSTIPWMRRKLAEFVDFDTLTTKDGQHR